MRYFYTTMQTAQKINGNIRTNSKFSLMQRQFGDKVRLSLPQIERIVLKEGISDS